MILHHTKNMNGPFDGVPVLVVIGVCSCCHHRLCVKSFGLGEVQAELPSVSFQVFAHCADGMRRTVAHLCGVVVI
jgi:hypothetical protein